MGKGLLANALLATEGTAQRISCKYDFIAREETLHSVVGYADALRLATDKLVYKAGIGVLLLNHGRYAHLLCRKEYRCRGVTSEARHNIGAELLDEFASLRDALHDSKRE